MRLLGGADHGRPFHTSRGEGGKRMLRLGASEPTAIFRHAHAPKEAREQCLLVMLRPMSTTTASASYGAALVQGM